MIRRSGTRDRTGDLVVLPEIQQRVLAESVQPNSAPSVAIADAHRDQPNMRRMTAGEQGGSYDLAHNRDGNRTEWILLSVFTDEDNLRATANGPGSHQTEVRRGNRMRTCADGKDQENRGYNK